MRVAFTSKRRNDIGQERFDQITRRLGNSTSRRTVVKGLGGGVLGGAMAALGLRRASAAVGKVGICHLDGDGVYHYISVSSNAVPAHKAHGDVINPDFATDVENCGGCGNVCGAPENATAYCSEEVCGFACNTGYGPDGNGGCVATQTGCSNALLSGPGGILFCVDDEIHVYINGTLKLENLGTSICYHTPVSLGPVANGDSIHVLANNSSSTCGDVSITPISLTCEDTGVEQTLDANGYGSTIDPGCGVTFYDRTFIVDL